MSELSMEAPIRELVKRYRDELQHAAKAVLELKKHSVFREDTPAPENADTGEMIANIMLTYRALEDARMRLGKVIQAHDGGESVYDKPEEERNPVDFSRNEGERSV